MVYSSAFGEPCCSSSSVNAFSAVSASGSTQKGGNKATATQQQSPTAHRPGTIYLLRNRTAQDSQLHLAATQRTRSATGNATSARPPRQAPSTHVDDITRKKQQLAQPPPPHRFPSFYHVVKSFTWHPSVTAGTITPNPGLKKAPFCVRRDHNPEPRLKRRPSIADETITPNPGLKKAPLCVRRDHNPEPRP